MQRMSRRARIYGNSKQKPLFGLFVTRKQKLEGAIATRWFRSSQFSAVTRLVAHALIAASLLYANASIALINRRCWLPEA